MEQTLMAQSLLRPARPDSATFWHPQVEQRPIRNVRPAKRNARTHGKKQLDKLIASIRQFGFLVPILIDEQGTVIAGHLRLEAAKALRMAHVPAIRITYLTDAEKRALALAENRIALDAGWDRETLAAELGELSVLLPEAELDLSVTGFDVAETDLILADQGDKEEHAGEDRLPERGPPVTRAGDLWLLGKHRLACADARDPVAYASLMRGETAGMVFTDPPYNVGIKKHARGRSAERFDEFIMASGEMSTRDYQMFLEQVLERMAAACADGSIAYVCIDWRHVQQLLQAGAHAFTELKNICVWAKSNAGQGSFYRSQHEMVAVFKVGTATHVNSFELGQYGRTRSNVWQYAGVNTFKAGRSDELNWHPTVKPARLVADAMLDCSRRGSIVLDPFVGSGTSIVAGETVGRRVYGMDLDPQYVDVALRRFERFSGRDAVLEATGQTFAEVQAERLEQGKPSISTVPNTKRAPRVISRKRAR
jgi:DNA modification methylase